MRVSVVLDKTSRFNIDLPAVEADYLYKTLVRLIINSFEIEKPVDIEKLMVKGLEPNKIITEDEAKEIEVDAHENIIKNVIIQEQTKDTDCNQRRLPRKLVMLKCSGCQETIASVVDEGQWSITCKSCNTNNIVENLKPATYICPNCGYKANFYVKDGLDLVKCKGCDGDIDLMYHDKKEKYLSVNLMK